MVCSERLLPVLARQKFRILNAAVLGKLVFAVAEATQLTQPSLFWSYAVLYGMNAVVESGIFLGRRRRTAELQHLHLAPGD